ncbi:response regulator [Sphingobium nicotianae]|uniref:Regulatory protein VirG n=1 Tax=Sphingobium nicotianae TaxID=2782607 RepID=A0A9X1IRK7_9SPHN|nr:response regulator [Sphingobium nicotianae]MBT2187290.1 response regulator [Sphingobium nicotianae]
MANLLVVDDDPGVRTLLSETLMRHAYTVQTAANAGEMDRAMQAATFDLIILDIMMPGEDGLSVCERLAARGGPPVIMLSALGEIDDRVAGLEIGAGHYLVKPCSPREILAHVKAALRSRETVANGARALTFNGWVVDLETRQLLDADGLLVDLLPGEFAVLRTFVERPRKVLSRDTLLDHARGPDTEAFDRAIDVQVSRLRRKLRAPGDEVIRTIRSEGYLFVPEVRPA